MDFSRKNQIQGHFKTDAQIQGLFKVVRIMHAIETVGMRFKPVNLNYHQKV